MFSVPNGCHTKYPSVPFSVGGKFFGTCTLLENGVLPRCAVSGSKKLEWGGSPGAESYFFSCTERNELFQRVQRSPPMCPTLAMLGFDRLRQGVQGVQRLSCVRLLYGADLFEHDVDNREPQHDAKIIHVRAD